MKPRETAIISCGTYLNGIYHQFVALTLVVAWTGLLVLVPNFFIGNSPSFNSVLAEVEPESENTSAHVYTCHKRREILTDTWGIITDGEGNYRENSHCEWLIRANTSTDYIHLKFTKLDTECAFDFVFVYDGDSYNSTLLGSFSGTTLPPVQIARSGKMLVMLFSDIEYALKGFEAEYSISECPFNCSMHGKCNNGTCTCEHLWEGEACELMLCPEECGYRYNRGTCDPFPKPPHCNCFPSFTGYSCSLGSNDTSGNSWHVVAPEGTGFVPRMGHAGAYLPYWDRFYVHGGQTLNEVLGDFYVYNMDNNRWELLAPKEEQHGDIFRCGDKLHWGPCPRHSHAAAAYGGGLVIYGGVLANGSFSSELWLYNATTNRWQLQATKSILRPLPLARHSLTVVDEYHLYLFGGNFENGSFSSHMFRINIKEGELAQWERVRPLGGLETSRRLAGHTAVFHPESRSIFVYGGIYAEMALISKLSDQIHVFNVDLRYWSQIFYPKPADVAHVPIERAFHSANIIGNYMVVFGGYTHDHDREEKCYDDRIYFYHLGCHLWINPEYFQKDFIGKSYPVPQGLYSHVAGVRGGNTLLIVGGFSGNVRGHFLAYTVPFTIAPPATFPTSSQFLCSNHKFRESCRANPDCGWCQISVGNGTCLERGDVEKCNQVLETSSCPGICPHLRDCQSCLAQGEQFRVDGGMASSIVELRPCIWNVHRRTCYCHEGFRMRSANSSMSIIKWWGPNDTLVDSLNDCRVKNFPPGITLLKYYHPPNKSQPDELSVVNSTSQSLSLYPQYTLERSKGGNFITRFYGFLHPICSDVKSAASIKMYLKLTKVRAIFQISSNDSPQNLEVVANFSSIFDSGGPPWHEVHRPNNKSLFINTSLRTRYLMDLEVNDIGIGNFSAVALLWNGCPGFDKHLTVEFLEPYSNGSCSVYTNCLQCLSDALCGWCETTSSCLPRLPMNNETLGLDCIDASHPRYLVTDAKDCATCSSNINCNSCAMNSLCEWLIPENYCVRRGRFQNSIRNDTMCPTACHKLADCESCLNNEGRCTWCESSATCMAFNTYTHSYHSGACGRWIDPDPNYYDSLDSLCRMCNRHKTCKDCLGDFSCGWCYSDHNPLLGVCTTGDFSGPSTASCRNLVSVTYNLSEAEATRWTYGLCPDVEECTMNLHNCHPNATCTNTFDSYICTCNRGFRGDGNDTCIQTCYENCIHGYCSEKDNYSCICDLGWSGVDCGINCNCHNHSTCITGVGVCDECHNWTRGEFCEQCKPGSYGNATTEKGCKECNCNGHGNSSLDYCDVHSGRCFCQDNTEGNNCELCREGYYGDPRNGSHCYRKCEARVLMTDVEHGGLGAQPGGASGETCLWILTVHPDLVSAQALSGSTVSRIVLTIESNLRVRCSDNYVYVYDGLPHFISSNSRVRSEAGALGVVCNMKHNESFTFEAVSGIMTVYYQRDNPNQGFNATFIVQSCQSSCPPNKHCVDGECRCLEGFVGHQCDNEICPNNCSITVNLRGRCNMEYGRCECERRYAGPDCSHDISPGEVLITSLVDVERLPQSASLVRLLPRMGHAMVADHRRSLWVFGGWSNTRGVLGDVLEFNSNTSTWEEVPVKSQPLGSHILPSGRYFHAAAYVTSRRTIFIYGGLTDSGEHKVLDDFWAFNINNRLWSPAPTMSRTPPPLAGHTLTNRADDNLILIGGFDMHYGFLEKVYEYDLMSGQWSILNVTGAFPIGIYGHTTVYHASSETFYIFGGVQYKFNKTEVSKELYAFHYPSKRWTVLPPSEDVNPNARSKNLPAARYLHSAFVSSEYMLVLGGQSETGKLVPFIHAYVFDCNMWIDISIDGTTVIGDRYWPASGMAAANIESSFYLFGGFTWMPVGRLLKLDIPTDLCSMYSTKENCYLRYGCSVCSVFKTDDVNTTYCYANKYEIPPSCQNPTGRVDLSAGMMCNKEWIERRDCRQYATCTDCLSSWPAHPTARNVCQWCCGKCIRYDGNCENEKDCHSKHLPAVKDVSRCPERQCSASDCEKCKDNGNCIWTRPVLKSSDQWKAVENMSGNIWNCFDKVSSAFNNTAVTMPPRACPPRCSQLKDCKTCLSSDGAEGGWHECRWSETLKECISPSYQHIRCTGGVCGRVLGQCPRPCVEFVQCSHCLSQPHCGWCSLSHDGLNGWGICMEGGLAGPSSGLCKPHNVTLVIESLPANVSLWPNHTGGVSAWSYLKCPPENECLNNHHTCDKKSEECFDLPEGFECRCRQGYILENKRCKPVCSMGCMNGTCTEPDVCMCDFGYVGIDCSVRCQCNGHSNCAGTDQLDVCLQCHNNTMGKTCEKCKPFFVGDPPSGGGCIPCKLYCNGHTDICLSSDNLAANNISSTNLGDVEEHQIEDLKQLVTEGPAKEAFCVNCQHFTEGDRCDVCIRGYFRTSDSPQDNCRPCECHGHSNICNPVTGEDCKCENNTGSDPQCNQKNKGNGEPCWKLQCSKCNEYFMGNPTNGHQCYRLMYVDRDYCFEPKKQNPDCMSPTPLLQGRTVFFGIQPRYMNVDIRVIVDITKGGVDFFFSPKDDTFVVEVNKSNGFHMVSIDSKYGIDLPEGVGFMFIAGAEQSQRNKRSIDTFKRVAELDSPEVSVNVTDCLPQFKVREKVATGLNTFVTITDPYDFLVVRDLQNRLVITLPQAMHDLRTARFYIVLHGRGDTLSTESYGTVFFRQDQPRIDLFVFFSVFFSCFFLFLAVCVVIWKVKQAVDLRRARQRHAVEMEHMASRPFAKMLVIIDEDPEDVDFFPYSPSYITKKPKGIKHSHGRDSPKFLSSDEKYFIRPVAIEPTDDGLAAINTVFFQLPGGESAPVRLALGSALVHSRAYPNTYNSIKACMRRRVSHHSQ